jgi:hypothetical protein
MQNRVLKKFLEKLWPPVAIMTYVLVVLEIGGYFTNPMQSIAFVGVMIFLPMLGYILRETWLQAKREVEWENKTTMETLKNG